MKLKFGINNCSNEQYHADKSFLSSTSLKTLLKDPQEFHTQHILKEGDNKSSTAFDEGTYAHSLILEPDNIENEFAFFPGWRKAGKEWEVFKASVENKIILSKPQKARVEGWVESYRNLPAAVNLIKGGLAEHTVAGELSGVPLKARADYINLDKKYIVDVKTTAHDAEVDIFKMVIKQFSYELSAALYCELFAKHYNKNFDFYFIVLSKKTNSCEVFKVSNLTLIEGKSLIKKALSIYSQCKKTGIWKLSNNNTFTPNSNYEILEV